MTKLTEPTIELDKIQLYLLLLGIFFMFVSATLVYATYITGFAVSVVIMITISREQTKKLSVKQRIAFELITFVMSAAWFIAAPLAFYMASSETESTKPPAD